MARWLGWCQSYTLINPEYVATRFHPSFLIFHYLGGNMISCVFIEHFFSNLVLILCRVITSCQSFIWVVVLSMLLESFTLPFCHVPETPKHPDFSVVEVPWRMSCVDPLFIVLICIMYVFKLYLNLQHIQLVGCSYKCVPIHFISKLILASFSSI